MKNKFLLAVFISAFLLIAPNVQAANFTDSQTVDANKTWTIRFTSDVGLDDETKQGITVTDSKGAAVNVDIQSGQDSKTVTVTSPQGGYTPGESYVLNVGSKAHSSKGKALKNEYKVHFSIKGSDGVVTFKDMNLEKAVREAINKPNGDLYKSDVENIPFLYAQSYGIQDISGIENLTKLQVIELSRNEISDINALKGLTNLRTLYLENNEISDISALKGLTNLQYISLKNNEISDISALKGLINLQLLILRSNQISDISALKGLTNLRTLYLENNEISDSEEQSLKNALPNCKFLEY